MMTITCPFKIIRIFRTWTKGGAIVVYNSAVCKVDVSFYNLAYKYMSTLTVCEFWTCNMLINSFSAHYLSVLSVFQPFNHAHPENLRVELNYLTINYVYYKFIRSAVNEKSVCLSVSGPKLSRWPI